MNASKHIAIIGAGMAAVTCARTLVQAGHRVSVFEKSHTLGGRMATRTSPFGTFDHGAQYFTVRDPRFVQALQTTPGVCRPWSANTVQVLDEHGRVAAAAAPGREPHWVASPGMSALVRQWAQPLVDAHRIELQTRVTAIERDTLNPSGWQLRTQGVGDSSHVYSGFDAVVLAVPSPQAQDLLQSTPKAGAMAIATPRSPPTKLVSRPCAPASPPWGRNGMPRAARTTVLPGWPGNPVNPAAASSSDGPCRPVPHGLPNTSKTTRNVCNPN